MCPNPLGMNQNYPSTPTTKLEDLTDPIERADEPVRIGRFLVET